mgnify:CR=1 FL=1|jgi:hypothetical protein
MGDRGNIGIIQPEGAVFLYAHWGGSDVKQATAQALAKGGECDYTYFTRIAMNELQGDQRGVKGFGISVGTPCDNEYDIPIVYWEDGKPVVEMLPYSWWRTFDKWGPGFAHRHTAEEFISLYLPVGAVR